VWSRVFFFIINYPSTHTKVVVSLGGWTYMMKITQEGKQERRYIYTHSTITQTCPCAGHENKSVSEYIAPIILNLDSISWWMVIFMSRLLYPWENSSWCTLNRGLSWPQGRSGHLGVEKKLLPCQELNHDSSNIMLFMPCIFLLLIQYVNQHLYLII
jgi:hypothetical protein